MTDRIIAIIIVLLTSYCFAGDNRWTSNGPFGGYFLTFAHDPRSANAVYVSGGDSIYRSQNGGQLWQRLDISGTDGSFPAAFTIRFTPGNPSQMLAAGSSVFISSNQGANWQQLSLNPAGGSDQFYDFEFAGSNPQTLYAVTYRHGFYRSVDGGRSWTAKNSGLKITPRAACCDLPQVEVDPTNPNTVYALLSSRILYKSTNGGDSWKAVPGLKFNDAVNSLILDPKSPQTLYAGGFEGIFKTTNGGNAWANTNCSCGIFSIAMDPRNSQTLYTVSSDLLKTTNGGGSWALLPAPIPKDGSWLGLSVSPNGAVFAGTFGHGVFRSMDGGRTWKEFTSRLDEQFIENVEASPQRASQLYATSAPFAFSSANSGNTWTQIKSLNLDARSLDVHPASSNVVAAAGDPAGFALSTDSGKTWAYRGPFHDVRQYCTDCVQFDPQDSNTVYMAPAGAGMARSTNRGAGWTTINSGLTEKNITVIAVDPRNGSTVFAGTPTGKVFKTTNSGGSWKNSSTGITGGYTLAITVSAADSNVAFASVDKPGQSLIYKSTNGGQNWTQKSHGLDPHFAIRAIAIDPKNASTIFAAGEAGVFVSADGGENWSAFDATGLTPFYIFDVQINAAEPDTLLIGTDHGVFSYTRKTASPGGPSITQIAPSSAHVGDSVLIQGSHFGGSQGSSTISFNGASAGTAASWSDTSISVKVPSGASSGPVMVTAAGKRSNGFGFNLLATSGNIEPASGPASGGTNVTILGPAAVSRIALGIVFGNQLAKNVRFTPPNIYTCTTPPGSGTVEVVVNNGGNPVHVGTYTYR